MNKLRQVIRTVCFLGCIALHTGASVAKPFAIQVVDADTGRGVPLVELRNVAGRSYFTDNAGLVAVDEEAIIDQEVYFAVSSHGYEFDADGFGLRGKRFRVKPGETERISIHRKNIAERLYRITGVGLYEHAVKLGQSPPVKQPLRNSGVVGSDSTSCAIFKGELFWIWGDTLRLSYPLGNFYTTGARSRLPNDGGLSPEVGVDLDYFSDGKGFVKGLAPFQPEGPVWLTALATVKDGAGKEHLVATYLKIKGPLKVQERGMCEWDDAEQVFHEIFKFPKDPKPVPEGHAFRHSDASGAWLYFGEATPNLRMPDRYEAWRDPQSYESVAADVQFRDANSNVKVSPHHGHVAWSPARKKWISVFCEDGGASSYLGETWYAEADRPEGPWRKAVKIITHDRYSFYNPTQHPYFADPAGRYLYLEGTYTVSFSGNDRPTPLYEYNQIMYRLDLQDPRLRPAQE